MIYMDNAATSYPKPESVYQAVDRFNRNLGGNPGRGSSRRTLESGSVLLDTRESLARLFEISDSSRIAFTLNVTEAINTGLKGFLKPGDHVITTSMEHNAVARPLFTLQARGVEWTAVECDRNGVLDPEKISQAIRPNTRMVCMLHASNVCGTIMPIREVGQIACENGLVFMVDCAQTAGVLPVSVKENSIDILAFTGHKGLLGPQGTGGLYVRPGLSVIPLKEGGTGSLSEMLEQPEFMPDLLESGTLNSPGIAGLGAGVEFVLEQGIDKIRAHEQKITELLIAEMRGINGVRIYGPESISDRTAVIAFNIEGIDCGELGMRLDYEYEIISRTGLHCAPMAHRTLGTLESGACRLSPGFFNTEEEVEQVIKAIKSMV